MLSAKQQQQSELRVRLVFAFTALPKDLQVALISSPARRQLLEDAAAAIIAVSSDEHAVVGADASASELAAGIEQLQQLMQELQAGGS
jgi:hypothetical protein